MNCQTNTWTFFFVVVILSFCCYFVSKVNAVNNHTFVHCISAPEPEWTLMNFNTTAQKFWWKHALNWSNVEVKTFKCYRRFLFQLNAVFQKFSIKKKKKIYNMKYIRSWWSAVTSTILQSGPEFWTAQCKMCMAQILRVFCAVAWSA